MRFSKLEIRKFSKLTIYEPLWGFDQPMGEKEREKERKKEGENNAQLNCHFGAGARTPLGPISDYQKC